MDAVERAAEKAAYEKRNREWQEKVAVERAWYAEERALSMAAYRNGDAAGDELVEARRQLADKLVKVQDEARQIARNMNDLVERIARQGLGAYLNSCGELQNSQTLEMAVAVYMERRDALVSRFKDAGRNVVGHEAQARQIVRVDGLDKALALQRERADEAAAEEAAAKNLYAKFEAMPEKGATGAETRRLRDAKYTVQAQAASKAKDAAVLRSFADALGVVIEEKRAEVARLSAAAEGGAR